MRDIRDAEFRNRFLGKRHRNERFERFDLRRYALTSAKWRVRFMEQAWLFNEWRRHRVINKFDQGSSTERGVNWWRLRRFGPDLAVTELTAASLLNRIRFNNDAGSQYTSVAYTDRIDELGVCALIGTVGDSAVCCCGPRGLNVVSKAME